MITEALLALAAAANPAVEAAPPSRLLPGTKAMIEAALASGDAAAVNTVLRLAKATNPAGLVEIETIETAYRTGVTERKEQEARQRREALGAAGALDNWRGQIEVGGSRSTGNTESLGLYAAVGLERDGLDWRHKLTVRADFQETNEVSTTKRALAAWQPNYKFDDRLYGYGLAQYEYDPLLGYDSRYSLGGGIGYAIVARPMLNIDLEGGPAVRFTDPVAGQTLTSLAGRASLNLGWKIAPTLELKQNGALFYEQGETSANAQTALDATLIGALKARLSYNVQYETNAPRGADEIDATSRATLIYSF